MTYWLLKTEPAEYSYDDLERAGSDVWDGVRNNAALKHMREMKPGDRAFIYHTGKEKAIVGIAEVASEAYPDPEAGEEGLVVVDVRPRRRLPRPVTLREIKESMAFRDWALVKQPRLSVMPVEETYWRVVHEIATGMMR